MYLINVRIETRSYWMQVSREVWI